MAPETAGDIVRQLLAITGPTPVLVHGGGAALLNALRDELIEAVRVDAPEVGFPDDAVLLLAAAAPAIENIAAWLAAGPNVVAIAGITEARAVALDEAARHLGWKRHPRSFRSQGLVVLCRAATQNIQDPDDTAQLYDLIANFIRPGDLVGDIGIPTTGRDILIANSFASDVTTLAPDVILSESEVAGTNFGCLIVHAATFAVAADCGLLPSLRHRVEPGGRLVLIGKADGKNTIDAHDVTAGFAGEFIAERMFSIIGGVIVESAVRQNNRDQSLTGTTILILMRDPLSPGASLVEQTFFVPDNPDFHVANFTRDYSHPALVKAIVVRGMRLSAPHVLVQTTRRLLPETTLGGVDRGALLCTLAYQLLEGGEEEAAEMPALLVEIAAWIAAQYKPQGHSLRWLVSLTSAKMKIEKRLGDFDAALVTAETCAAIDPVPFSPLLASRTIEALFTAATIRLVRGQIDEAIQQLDRAIPIVQNALGGDWLNIVGDPANPLPFGLPEVALFVGIAARCVALRAYIDQFPQKPGLVWAQALALSNHGFGSAPILATANRPQSMTQVRNFAEEFYRLTHAAEQVATAELARVNALLVESRAQLAARDAEVAAYPPLVEALRQSERSNRTQMAMMRKEASARSREAETNAAELALSRAREESARKAAEAARLDAWHMRRQLSDTFERLADAERRAAAVCNQVIKGN